LALVFCWVPILGEVLMVIAAVAGIVAALANILLAATGEKSWGEAAMSVVFAVLGCIGVGGALRTLGGAAKVGAGLRAGAEAAGAASGASDLAGVVLAKGVKYGADGVIEITLKFKAGWNASQKAQAALKIADVNAGGAVVTVVDQAERAVNPRRMWESVMGKITTKGVDVDHILDLQLGGKNLIGNLQLLDRSVNRSFGAQINNAIRRAGLSPETLVRLLL
jgi:hypothetical protein